MGDGVSGVAEYVPLNVAAMLSFLALIQHTHALGGTHGFFPSTTGRTTAAANSKIFPLSSKVNASMVMIFPDEQDGRRGHRAI
jgi:hypothetical protein